ncbi:histidine kinase dimerization/phospho-acceptor domain-containing protein [Paenibacillus sp. JX-17]|uniref:histidine kinase n=1 Tax=Paenibacillus lacisoli TaxID=3064525 RepID=A0ABT9CCU2_9BACL|nr:histidine kinase dimerization/phospho-acceptor domain-containing protein [Paenibacillus sp. JX-17]MDO7906398.1 histidine kinase dimerization/phospho-acceptor domain-containing protein [Paenibacillus sp. JX-17]
MADIQSKALGNVPGLHQAAEHVLSVLSGVLQADTVFIAHNDGVTNRMMKVFNRDEPVIQEGDELPFSLTYCSLVLEQGEGHLIIPSTASHPIVSSWNVTRELGDRSFIGVPVRTEDGSWCGTICALDDPSYSYSDEEIEVLQSMALFLGYAAELEQAVKTLQARQEEMTEMNSRLERTAERNQDLLSLMGHEIMMPLTGIMGMTDLLQESELTEEQRNYVDVIKTSNQSLMELINDVVYYSQLDSGSVQIEEEPFDLRFMINNVIAQMQLRLDQSASEISLSVQEEISTVLIGDAGKLEWVISKLLGYVVHIMETRHMTIEVVQEVHPSSDIAELCFTLVHHDSVKKSQTIAQLMDAFNEVHHLSAKDRGTWIGPGLYISKQLVTMLGGNIEVEPIEDERIRLCFTVPLRIYQHLEDQLPAH